MSKYFVILLLSLCSSCSIVKHDSSTLSAQSPQASSDADEERWVISANRRVKTCTLNRPSTDFRYSAHLTFDRGNNQMNRYTFVAYGRSQEIVLNKVWNAFYARPSLSNVLRQNGRGHVTAVRVVYHGGPDERSTEWLESSVVDMSKYVDTGKPVWNCREQASCEQRTNIGARASIHFISCRRDPPLEAFSPGREGDFFRYQNNIVHTSQSACLAAADRMTIRLNNGAISASFDVCNGSPNHIHATCGEIP